MAKKKTSTPTPPANKKTAQQQTSESDFRIVSSTRRAFFNYEILERYEAGILLTGTEIKSIRAGKIDLSDAYARAVDGEMWLNNAYIAPYDSASHYNHDPKRNRKLLLHRVEIQKMSANVSEKGLTIVALRVYIKRHHAKIELGLGRGKRQFDKRHAIRDRDMDREAKRAIGSLRE